MWHLSTTPPSPGDRELVQKCEETLRALRQAIEERKERTARRVDIRSRVQDAVESFASADSFARWLQALDPEEVPPSDRNSIFQFVLRASGAQAQVQGKKGKKGKKAKQASWRTHEGRMLTVIRALVLKPELFSAANMTELERCKSALTALDEQEQCEAQSQPREGRPCRHLCCC